METLKNIFKPSRYRKAVAGALVAGAAVLQTLGADLGDLVREDVEQALAWAFGAGGVVYVIENKLKDAKGQAQEFVDEFKNRL